MEDVPSVAKPQEAFQLFFDDDLVDKIQFQINLESVQNGKPANVRKEKLKNLIGISIEMAYNQMHAIVNYWKDGDDLEVPCIKKTMPRERFQVILRNVHLNDNFKPDPGARNKL